jgi:hypothetical protein
MKLLKRALYYLLYYTIYAISSLIYHFAWYQYWAITGIMLKLRYEADKAR